MTILTSNNFNMPACPICKINFNDSRSLQGHIRMSHKGPNEDNEAERAPKKLKLSDKHSTLLDRLRRLPQTSISDRLKQIQGGSSSQDTSQKVLFGSNSTNLIVLTPFVWLQTPVAPSVAPPVSNEEAEEESNARVCIEGTEMSI